MATLAGSPCAPAQSLQMTSTAAGRPHHRRNLHPDAPVRHAVCVLSVGTGRNHLATGLPTHDAASGANVLITLLLTMWTAHAEPAGYCHTDIGGGQLFARAQQVAGTTFEQRSETAQALAAALANYEVALDLLGDQAPAAERTRQASLQDAFNRDFAVLQAFTNEQLDGFENAFVGAMQRALEGLDAVECRPTGKRSGPRLAPRFGGSAPEEVTCEGQDLNKQIASQMDADPQLEADLGLILEREWPELTVDAQPQAPIDAAAQHVIPVQPFFALGAADAMEAISEADDDARATFEEAIAEGATTEQLRHAGGPTPSRHALRHVAPASGRHLRCDRQAPGKGGQGQGVLVVCAASAWVAARCRCSTKRRSMPSPAKQGEPRPLRGQRRP